MLTRDEKRRTSKELKENYKRLNMDILDILDEVELDEEEFKRVLNMDDPYPGNVWKVRDYFVYKLNDNIYSFSVLSDPSANHWYYYDKPWLN